MQFQYIPYIAPLTVSAFTSLFLGINILLTRRNSKGAVSFILSMLVVTIWSFCNALEMSAVDFRTKLFWANMQYFAYCYSPVTLLALCMQFTGYDDKIQNRKVLWFAVIPTIIVIFVWTDQLHGLVRYDMYMDYSGPFPVISKKYGPVFFVHMVYSYFLNITALVLLIKTIFSPNAAYRKQAIVLFFGVILIVIPNMLYILGFGPVKRFDITPVFFGPAGLIIVLGIFRFKLFDIVPLARATVIEIMDVGMLVIDSQNRILDVNPAFERIVGLSASQISAKRAEEVFNEIPELKIACMDRSITHAEFSINQNQNLKIYELFLSQLTDNRGIFMARLAVVYEITEKKQAQREFLKQQRKLAVIEERERMSRNMHDNLCQVLGFINVQAQGIRQELMNEGVETASHEIDKLVNVAQSAHNEIREYIRNVINATPSQKNFIAVLKKDILNFEEQTNLTVNLNIPGEFTGEELEPNEQFNLLNIIREAMNNIRKHAEASNVKITFLFSQKRLFTTIEDDGKGFHNVLETNCSKNNFGLDIMKKRAAEIGARIHIKSELGKGSRIDICLPIKGEEI